MVIVYRRFDDDGIPHRGWTEHDYTFSGYTLVSVRFFPDWDEADQAAIARWVQEPAQKHRSD